MDTQEEKASYSIGLNCATFLERDMNIGGIKDHLHLDTFMQGIRDHLEGNDLKITRPEMQLAIEIFKGEMEKKAAEAAEESAKIYEAFHKKNAAKDGVKVTESGLQYKVITEGEGESPKEDDNVLVHYSGTLIDGTEFDSSYARNTPATFKPTQVIKGWTEALMMMKAGSKWEVVIPGELAYGERGSPPKIGPNATLCFTIELLEIKKDEPVEEDAAESSEAEKTAE